MCADDDAAFMLLQVRPHRDEIGHNTCMKNKLALFLMLNNQATGGKYCEEEVYILNRKCTVVSSYNKALISLKASAEEHVCWSVNRYEN